MEAPQPVHPDLQLSLLRHIQDQNEAYVVEQEDAERIAYYLHKASFVVAFGFQFCKSCNCYGDVDDVKL